MNSAVQDGQKIKENRKNVRQVKGHVLTRQKEDVRDEKKGFSRGMPKPVNISWVYGERILKEITMWKELESCWKKLDLILK